MRTAERVAVIGDVGGHAGELRAELTRLGADPVTGRLPAGLVVVQVGDLIHRGPDSAGVTALVDEYLSAQPGQWVQLVGNHEAQYLRQPAFEWPEKLDPGAVDALRRWWKTGSMVAAVSFEPSGVSGSSGAGSERFLVTHAGLTRGFWSRVLGGIDDPARAAAALNSFIGSHEDVLFHGGQMLGGGRPDELAGPVWAAAATELLPSWLGNDLPFSQIHGHSTVSGRSGARRTAREVDRLTSLDETTRHETTDFGSGRIIGVDPGHARRPQHSWRAWRLDEPVRLHT